METNNELKRLAATETTRIAQAILRGEKPEGAAEPTTADRSHQDVLDSVTKEYRAILNPPKESNAE